MKFNNINSKGDTIVEVLIAVVIVGIILTGAFKISNQSLSQIRQAQERTEAQKVAVKSVEKLNKTVKQNPTLLTTNPLPPFCISSTYTIIAPPTCAEGSDSRYKTVINRQASPPNQVFVVKVIWDSLNGKQENVTFFYRIKEPETP